MIQSSYIYDNNGTPIGFIYNGTQYLYITNQMVNVIRYYIKNNKILHKRYIVKYSLGKCIVLLYHYVKKFISGCFDNDSDNFNSITFFKFRFILYF